MWNEKCILRELICHAVNLCCILFRPGQKTHKFWHKMECKISFTAFLTWIWSYLLHYSLAPCSRVLREKLNGSQLVKNFPAFYGTRRFVTAFKSARHLSISWAHWQTCQIKLKVLKIRPPPFWDFAPRVLVVRYRRFGSISRQHLRGSRSPRRTNPSRATYHKSAEGASQLQCCGSVRLTEVFTLTWVFSLLFPQL
jgi:hypothetical protein